VTRRLVRSPRAIRDLLEIWTYIAQDDPAAADRLVDGLDLRMRVLLEQPFLGRSRPELAPGLRTLPSGNYLILYRVGAGRIEIVRCVHGARRLGPLVS
jgi:toxin ParE1/3/4